MTFKELGLDNQILENLVALGYQTPTEIQKVAIGTILQGSDLIASAQTGSGKTAAFILPALQLLLKPRTDMKKGPRILVLVPTRELGMQVADAAIKYSKGLKRVRTVCIYGGVSYMQQRKQLERPYDILIATPGRLMDLMEQKRISLNNIELFVLDEVDRLLDVGFIGPITEIAETLPEKHQTIMFSATVKGGVAKLAKDLLKDPVIHTVNPKSEMNENIEQRLHYVDNLQHKMKLLDHCLQDPTMRNAIIFTATKSFADELVEELREEGHRATALHGDMQQRVRTRKLADFREGKVRILVATDVAARGIDVNTITHVLNFDLPRQAEDYVHRIGRTGRAGAKGVALSFASHKDRDLVRKIEDYTGQKIATHVIAGLEPQEKAPKPKPSGRNKRPFFKGRGASQGGPRGNGSQGPRGSSSGPRGGGPRGSSQGPKGTGRPFFKKKKPATATVK